LVVAKKKCIPAIAGGKRFVMENTRGRGGRISAAVLKYAFDPDKRIGYCGGVNRNLNLNLLSALLLCRAAVGF
jgi:hypothetical protein